MPVKNGNIDAQSVVAIDTRSPGDLDPNYCTGTIIDDDLIVTAGHCRVSKNDTIILGTDPASKTAIRIKVDAVESPGYISYSECHNAATPCKNNKDISLLLFKGGIPKGFKKSKICDSKLVPPNTTITTFGYGDFGKDEKTGASLHTSAFALKDLSYSKTQMQLNVTPAHSMEGGDSGGPAFVTVNGERCLLGVDNWGWDRADEKPPYYEVYTKPTAYKEWIISFAKKLRIQSGETFRSVSWTCNWKIASDATSCENYGSSLLKQQGCDLNNFSCNPSDDAGNFVCTGTSTICHLSGLCYASDMITTLGSLGTLCKSKDDVHTAPISGGAGTSAKAL